MEMPQSLPENEHMEYVVQINSSDEVNLSNFSQYTLVPQEETEMVPGEIAGGISDETDMKLPVDESWHENLTSEVLTETEVSSKTQESSSGWTPGELSMLKEIDRYIKQESGSPQCHGQGDGPDNSLLTSAEVPHIVKSEPDEQFTVKLQPLTGNSTVEEHGNRLIYATLESARMSCVNFDTPRFPCRFPTLPPVFATPQADDSRLEAFSPRGMLTKPPPARGFRPRQVLKTPIMPPYVIRTPVATTVGNSSDSSSGEYSFSSASPQFPDNSSSSVGSDTSPDYPKPPNNTPNSAENQESPPMASLCVAGQNRLFSHSQLNSRLERLSQFPHSLDLRAIHNAKERKRRSRIRDACQAMRRLLPGVNERTDNASVFEQFANYISFLKLHIGDHYDMDYLREYQLMKDKYHPLTFNTKLECNK